MNQSSLETPQQIVSVEPPKKTSVIKIIFLIIACIGLFLYIFFLKSLTDNKTNQPGNQPKQKLITVSSMITPTPKPLDILDSTEQKLLDLVRTQNPQIALTELQQDMNQQKIISRSCHALIHKIGREAFKKYQDFGVAISYQNEICGSGYLHGVIEAYFKQVPRTSEAVQTICSSYGLKSISGKCYHGIGHGIMYYNNNNVPLSVASCNSYKEQEAIIRCSEGVFMENFNTNTDVHPSRYLDPSNPLYPCNQQEGVHKGTCYFYAPLYYLNLHPDNYKGAFTMCSGAEALFRTTCATGVGSRLIKYNLLDVPFVIKTCDTQAQEYKKACIDGVVSYYLVQYDSLQKGRDFCTQLSKEDQAICYQGIESRKNLLPE